MSNDKFTPQDLDSVTQHHHLDLEHNRFCVEIASRLPAVKNVQQLISAARSISDYIEQVHPSPTEINNQCAEQEDDFDLIVMR